METMNETTKDQYLIGRKKYVRVTTLLEKVGHSDFSDIPHSERQFYMDRGKANHELWQRAEEGTDHQYHFDSRVELYRAGHAKFIRETGFKPLAGGIEKFIKATWAQLGFKETSSDEEGYAGTMDRLGLVGNRLWLPDYKTSNVPESTAAQTALYLIGLMVLPKNKTWNFSFKNVDRYGVAFRNDGSYFMTKRYPDSDYHLALSLIEKYLTQEKS